MKKYNRSPLNAIREAFNQAKSNRGQSDADIEDCIIIEKPHVSEFGLGSKIYVLIVDIKNIYIGSSFYCNE